MNEGTTFQLSTIRVQWNCNVRADADNHWLDEKTPWSFTVIRYKRSKGGPYKGKERYLRDSLTGAVATKRV